MAIFLLDKNNQIQAVAGSAPGGDVVTPEI
jgi:hypothetical protein